MLKVILAFLFVATIYAAYIQVDNSGHFFKISLNGASEVRWTKDNNNYRHLQELARFCPVPGTPVALGGIGNWQCGPLDTLLNLNCSLIPGNPFFPVVKQVNGSFQCAPEQDTLAYLLPTCSNGQTVKYINGVWTCAFEADTFRDLTLSCPAGSTIFWNTTAFVCSSATSISDSDILGAIVCPAGQLVRFNQLSSTFICDSDFNTLPTGCTNGQVVIYDGTQWTCKNDSDFLSRVGIPTCSAATPYLKYRNGAWICTDQFFVLNFIGQPGFLTYLQSANLLQQTADPQSLNAYQVLWGSINQNTLFSTSPPVFPFNGTITSTYVVFQNFQSSTGATVAVDFTVAGTAVSSSISFTASANPGVPQTLVYLSPVFTGQTFQAGQGVALGFRVTSGDLSTFPPLLSSIYVAVYISVSI
eukprot:TRINITY_DN892_c1_g1_i2.p1 TRINITY_DN892_c1_g1~~TRINITY_DN892_c1_g1_i2.p1  ORF type:complete len:415 (-),score=127.43 TRINITY_DN892_c1_g1_i2:84-1328(-)